MKIRIPFITVLSIFCAGCSSYDYSGDDIEGVKALISGTILTESRATGTVWTENDCIGVTCEDNINIPYKYSGSSSTFAVDDESLSIYFLGQPSHTLTAYYPFAGTSGIVPGQITVETTSEKQTSDKQPAIDFLYATAEASRSNPNVNFTFCHQMSRVDLLFEAKDGLVLDNIKYALTGLKLKGVFDTVTGETAITGDALAQALEQEIQAGTMMQTTLILFPQKAMEVGFEIEMGGKSFIKKMGEMELKPGFIHAYTVSFSQKDETVYMTVETGDVKDWSEGNRQEVNTGDGTHITEVTPGSSDWGEGNSQKIDSGDGNS